MAVISVPNGGADLSEFRFTPTLDVVTVRNVVVTVPGILNYTSLTNGVQPTNTGFGVDFVRGALQATANSAAGPGANY